MTSLGGINGRPIQALLKGENDSKQSNEIQATEVRDIEFISKQLCQFFCLYFFLSLQLKFRVRFFTKIQIRKRIYRFFTKSKNGLLIQMIHNGGGFFGSYPKPDTLDTYSSCSTTLLIFTAI